MPCRAGSKKLESLHVESILNDLYSALPLILGFDITTLSVSFLVTFLFRIFNFVNEVCHEMPYVFKTIVNDVPQKV